MPTNTYMDYERIVNSATIGDFGNTVSFSIADDQLDFGNGLGYISYYGLDSAEEDNLATDFANKSAIYSAFLNITSGDQSNEYSVLFSDVANITFLNTDQNGNNTFDQNEPVGEIVFGLVTGSHPSFSPNLARSIFIMNLSLIQGKEL